MESVSDHPLVLRLQGQYPGLLRRALSDRWILALPPASNLQGVAWGEDLLRAHLLVELGVGSLRTVLGHRVARKGARLVVQAAMGSTSQAHEVAISGHEMLLMPLRLRLIHVTAPLLLVPGMQKRSSDGQSPGGAALSGGPQHGGVGGFLAMVSNLLGTPNPSPGPLPRTPPATGVATPRAFGRRTESREASPKSRTRLDFDIAEVPAVDSAEADTLRIGTAKSAGGIRDVTGTEAGQSESIEHGRTPTPSAPASPREPFPQPESTPAPAMPPVPPAQLCSVAQAEAYIDSLPGGDQVLELIAHHAATFNHSYVMVKSYHGSTARKLKGWVDELVRALLGCWPPDWPMDPGHRESIEGAVEAVLMRGVHAKVMDSLAAVHGAADAALRDVMEGLLAGRYVAAQGSKASIQPAPAGSSGGGPEARQRRAVAGLLQLAGVPEALARVDVAGAAGELARLAVACCPLEVVHCLHRAQQAIVGAVDAFRASESKDAGAVSSDDLLPLFIVALVSAAPPGLESVLQYVRTFHLSGDWCGFTGFQVATFEAAVSFLQQHLPKQPQSGQQTGRGSQGRVTAEPAAASAGPQPLIPLHPAPLSPWRRPLSREPSLGALEAQFALEAVLDSDLPLTFSSPDPSPVSTPTASHRHPPAPASYSHSQRPTSAHRSPFAMDPAQRVSAGGEPHQSSHQQGSRLRHSRPAPTGSPESPARHTRLAETAAQGGEGCGSVEQLNAGAPRGSPPLRVMPDSQGVAEGFTAGRSLLAADLARLQSLSGDGRLLPRISTASSSKSGRTVAGVAAGHQVPYSPTLCLPPASSASPTALNGLVIPPPQHRPSFDPGRPGSPAVPYSFASSALTHGPSGGLKLQPPLALSQGQSTELKLQPPVAEVAERGARASGAAAGNKDGSLSSISPRISFLEQLEALATVSSAWPAPFGHAGDDSIPESGESSRATSQGFPSRPGSSIGEDTGDSAGMDSDQGDSLKHENTTLERVGAEETAGTYTRLVQDWAGEGAMVKSEELGDACVREKQHHSSVQPQQEAESLDSAKAGDSNHSAGHLSVPQPARIPLKGDADLLTSELPSRTALDRSQLCELGIRNAGETDGKEASQSSAEAEESSVLAPRHSASSNAEQSISDSAGVSFLKPPEAGARGKDSFCCERRSGGAGVPLAYLNSIAGTPQHGVDTESAESLRGGSGSGCKQGQSAAGAAKGAVPVVIVPDVRPAAVRGRRGMGSFLDSLRHSDEEKLSSTEFGG